MQLIRSLFRHLSALLAAAALTATAFAQTAPLRLEAGRQVLLAGETTSIRVFHGTTDITAHPETRFSVDNPGAGSVSAAAVFTALAPGDVLVIATNNDFENPEPGDTVGTLLLRVHAADDRDNDGISDAYEAAHGLSPEDPADAEADSDGDGLDNVTEFRRGTDPRKTDSDADGLPDGQEVALGRDPLKAEQFARPAMNVNCVVSVLNRTAQVRADGSWILPNVPANFGLVRARGTCTENGVTRSGQSDYFTVPEDGIVKVAQIRFEAVAPVPASLTVTSPVTSLTSAGATAQLAVQAVYADGATADVSRGAQGTTYATSNAGIVTVSADGLVTAVSSGTALISAMNDGALGMLRITVATSGDADADGLPDSWETENGLNPNDPSDAATDLDSDGLPNLEEFRRGTDPRAADSDLDGLSDGDEIQRGTNPLLADSDGDGVPDGLEVQANTDPLDRNSYDLAQALQSITITPASAEIIVNMLTGEGSRRVTVTGLLRDGRALDLTARSRGTTYTSSNLQVLNFGATDGQLFGGADGTATLTVANSGISATAAITVRNFAPQSLAYLSMPGFANDVDISGDYAYVAAGSAGLVVVDVARRAEPKIVKTLALGGNGNGIKVVGGRAFVAAGAAGMHVIDVTAPASARLLGTIDTPGTAWDLAVAGDRVYVADGNAGLHIVDASNPAQPRLVATLDTPGTAKGVDVNSAGMVVVADGNDTLIVNATAPSAPFLAGTASTDDARDVTVDGSIAYVADYTSSLRVVDFTNAASPNIVGTTTAALGGFPVGLVKAGQFVFGADVFFVNGVPITSVATPSSPVVRARLDFPQRDDDGTGIAADHQFVYLTANRGIVENGTSGDSRLYIGQYLSVEDTAGLAPTVRLTAPRNVPTAFEGTLLELAADAEDDILVARVDFVVNGQVVATDAAAPYATSYRVPQGIPALTIEARAHDVAGNTAVSPQVTIDVLPDPRTTVTGVIRYEDGAAAADAAVSCLGVMGTSVADGGFSIAGVPTVDGPIVCTANLTAQNVSLTGRSTPVAAVAGGITSAGTITVKAAPKSVCGEPECVAPDGAYISHFTGTGCTGTESYYLPYDGYGFKCRPWDGQGQCGTVRRTVTNRSAKTSDGRCHDAWPSGNTLADFVTVYRSASMYTLSPAPDPAYPDRGGELTDGVTATGESWVNAAGWLETNPTITHDLGSVGYLTKVEMYVGNSFGVGTFGVFRPARVDVAVSSDNVNFTPVGSLTFNAFSHIGTKEQVDLGTLSPKASGRWVRYTVTRGGSWVMVMEIRGEAGDAPTTTMASGTVVRHSGAAASGAAVTCGGITGITGADGRFSIDGVPALQGNITCSATWTNSEGIRVTGTSAAVPPVAGGTTAVGTITLGQEVAAGACGEAQCVPNQGVYVSHFTGAGCTGTESYYLPYDGYAFSCRSWDGRGICGTIRRTQTNRSARINNGPCQDLWPAGNTLTDFVTIYR